MGYFRLGWVRIKDYPAGTINRKATVKYEKETSDYIHDLINLFVGYNIQTILSITKLVIKHYNNIQDQKN